MFYNLEKLELTNFKAKNYKLLKEEGENAQKLQVIYFPIFINF